jgi:hypothetical protein
LKGAAGNDKIDGGLGADKIWGDDGDDILYGGTSQQLATVESDAIYGGNGNDIIYGNGGDDFLYGDAGTDTVRGEVGNDTIKGGTGISYLYGGDGHDQLYYDPTTDNISKLGQYLSGSIIDGGIHNDTLNIFNKATYTSGTTQKATQTHIWFEQGVGHIRFENPNGGYSDAGIFKGIENITVNGAGPLIYEGDWYYSSSESKYVIGTSANDTFNSYYDSSIMKGGAGNDTFRVGGSGDQVRSETNDADIIYINDMGGSVLIEGFNGVGTFAGDRLYLNSYNLTNPDEQISVNSGITNFHLDNGGIVQVVGVGLVEGVDYFIG